MAIEQTARLPVFLESCNPSAHPLTTSLLAAHSLYVTFVIFQEVFKPFQRPASCHYCSYNASYKTSLLLVKV